MAFDGFKLFTRVIVLTIGLGLPQSASAHTPPERVAKRLFSRLTGTPMAGRDSRLKTMSELLSQGDDFRAAEIAMDDEDFYGVTIKHWASQMANKEENPFVPLDDFQALVIGIVRDDLDARLLLTGDFTYAKSSYVGNPSGFDYLMFDKTNSSYKTDLIKTLQKTSPDVKPSGVLTTRAWAKAHYSGGTNRRAVQYAFQEFLCIPIDQWKTQGLDDRFVRQDVDRKPGKNPLVYQTQCRSCHAPMDAMAGAFAQVDFDLGRGSLAAFPSVHPKYTQNSNVYPEGNRSLDGEWVNLLAMNHVQDEFFGWDEDVPIQGEGIQSFGRMLGASKAFRTCMVKRAFKAICMRDPVVADDPSIQAVSESFASHNYSLKRVFGEVALLPACLGARGEAQ